MAWTWAPLSLAEKLCEERDKGAAILLISEELDEVIRLSDRILVMSKGEIAATLGRDADPSGNPGRDHHGAVRQYEHRY